MLQKQLRQLSRPDYRSSEKRKPRFQIIQDALVADIKKEGSAYDLTIAIGILAASQQIENSSLLADYIIMGELALDGDIRPVKGQSIRLNGPNMLKHVIRTSDVYLVSRLNGELVVGGTVEEKGFDKRLPVRTKLSI